MADILAFITARLDHEAETARIAAQSESPFAVGDEPERRSWEVENQAEIRDSSGQIVVFDEGAPSGEQAAHIALQDPLSALNRVRALRIIVSEHESVGGLCGRCSKELDEVQWPCPTLRALASVWRSHPDWQGW